jgi:hypothetical protein
MYGYSLLAPQQNLYFLPQGQGSFLATFVLLTGLIVFLVNMMNLLIVVSYLHIRLYLLGRKQMLCFWG